MPDTTPLYIANRYQLLTKLGEGGMGIVYRAYDRLTGQTVALKQLTVPGELLVFSSRPSLTNQSDVR
ncbi:MAG: hypothetical protein H7Y11_09960, partial [Armatimonadetes bacterium]|nr:hypothetical protein [Anaerolineae bacterium]